ncbi:amidophosphoribosyltransferase [bacterium]|jgi:amidophosphoribosyltransferase|nr:amidophosphoribosyltransferase [bacterium]MDB4576526.1 amidophosphoribosyltransferase [Akkermansiaceae bacterium]MDB4687378.1 amidophosphoribosyltransferase [Akkermansiaceae bacterium]MDC0305398.1 amidophosphoribosyltransferase [bacterium]
MSDPLKHECGIAVVRLKKPLAYYQDRYGSALWGFNKLFLLMEKQHNRGQDGVGIGCAKIGMPAGQPYIFRRRDSKKDSLAKLFRKELKELQRKHRKGLLDQENPDDLRTHFDFAGDVYMGHLRYGTSGEFDAGSCHPYLRRSNWPTRSLMVMGNFNMTNTSQLNQRMLDRGQHPVFGTDTQTVLEEIGFHLDEAHTDIYHELRDEGIAGDHTAELISERLNLAHIVAESAKGWDGGYCISGVVGNGDLFVMRDPHGIRPCHYYETDEVIAFASERVPLMTVFEAEQDEVKALDPGTVMTIKNSGEHQSERFAEKVDPKPCSFEKIYFSRGNDPQIYKERKAMGAALVDQVVQSIGHDFDKSVFSFVPNTAETAYYGLMDGLRLYRRKKVRSDILEALQRGELTEEKLDDLVLRNWPVGEKIAHKDIKLRTFISKESGRNQLVSHVYDISYGVVGEGDSLVVLDDSIVRGTTLKQSILKILARTKPGKIVICSTAPQIRYPDCYGIDMSEMGKFIAFQATINLLERSGRGGLIEDVYKDCIAELEKPPEERINAVKRLYADFTDDEISKEIAAIVYPEDIDWHGEVEVLYQTVDNLHDSIEGPSGDWYFTGDYPTKGGVAVANRAFIHWREGKAGRSYDLHL